MEAALKELDEKVAVFEGFRPQLGPDLSCESFMAMVHALEEVTQVSNRIMGFARLRFSENTQAQDSLSFIAKVEQIMADLQNRTLFFELWWKELDDKEADRYMAEAGDFGYFLEEMRHFKPHTLTEPEEKIINIKDVTGARAIITLYELFTTRYQFNMEVEGEQKSMTRGELMVYARHHDPALRVAAYQELYRVYGQDGPILGQMYQTMVRDWKNENVDLRHHVSPISVRNLHNDIPDRVVETLLEVCRENAPLFQRFFKLKARWLGLEKLRRYDIYAPVAVSDKTYDFNTAVEMILESFGGFHPEFADLAQKIFDDEHIDSEVRPGKSDGAYCASTVPELTPWVLLSFQGRASDAATMAHELGHAVHAMLARHHNVFTFHSSLPLAENASTFSEMLLIDRLLTQESDQAVRRDLLFRQVDDAYATIMRQAFFALFELEAHDMIAAGKTADQISEAYFKNLETQFGDAVCLSEEFKWEWVSIPHFFHAPFYVYAYAFGQLLVLSLYQQYKEEKETFVPRYIDILSAGGSESPVDILGKAGIDVHDAGFWQGGFDVILDLIQQLEAIPVEKA
ncbi:MAG: M3 family oligoendopeptidase [Deltaproteobacteria bacterium]|nr:M3 family oligoendopeptidase [Deltaproteobacteria bacterium]